MNADDLRSYQQRERVGRHSPDGFTGKHCASCSGSAESPVPWPCGGARNLRRMQRGSE